MDTVNDPLADVGDIPDKQPLAPPPENDRQRKRPAHSPLAWIIFAGIVILIAILIVVFGWRPRHRRQQKINQQAEERTSALPRVNVQVVQPAPSTSELMVPGTTLAYTEAQIYARASGYVTRRLVDIGDRVHQGQLMAVIDAPDLDKQVAQGRSTLAQSESNLVQLQAQLHLQDLNWQRYKVLVAKGVFSRQEGDTQEANFRVAEANVRAAQNTVQANRDNLERLIVLQQYEHVTAPFNGVITARNIDVGALIGAQGTGGPPPSGVASPGTTQSGAQGNNQGAAGNLSSQANPATGGAQGGPMFTVAEIDRLRILVSVPEAYSSLIHVGQRAKLFFDEQPSNQLEAHVTRTSASIDQNTRTLLVEVQVRNARQNLLPGMYVVVNFIDVKGQPPLVIPGEAIVVRNGNNVVALVQNNVVHYRQIQLGRDFGNETQIVSGLNAGDVIASTITDEVQDGIKIDPQYPKKTGTPQQGGQTDQSPGSAGRYGDQGLTNSAQKSGKKGSGSTNGSGNRAGKSNGKQ